MSPIILMPLLILGLMIALGAIAGVYMLLANKKTRTAGFVVLALGFGVLVCGGGSLFVFLFSYRGTRAESEDALAAACDLHRAGEEMEKFTSESSGCSGMPTSPVFDEPASPNKPEASVTADDTPKEDKPAATPEPAPEHDPRPKWIDGARTPRVVKALVLREEDHKFASSEKVYQVKATVGPYTSRMECDAHLTADVQEPVARYVETILGGEAARHVRLPDQYIRQHVVEEQWEEPVDASFGPMVQLHVLLQFDHKTRELVKKQWHDHQVQQRLWYSGGGLAAVLLLLTLAYGFLKGGWSMPGPTVLLAVTAALGVAVVIVMLVMMVDTSTADRPADGEYQPPRIDSSVDPAPVGDAHGKVADSPSGNARIELVRVKTSAVSGVGALALVLFGVSMMLISSKRMRPYGFAVLGLLAVLLCVAMMTVA